MSKKLTCPKCKSKWRKDYRLTVKVECDNMPYTCGDVRLADLGFCPVCFFDKDDDFIMRGVKVPLDEDRVEVHRVVLEDEFGNYEDFSDDSSDHNTFWGGAGPDCTIVRREAAI